MPVDRHPYQVELKIARNVCLSWLSGMPVPVLEDSYSPLTLSSTSSSSRSSSKDGAGKISHGMRRVALGIPNHSVRWQRGLWGGSSWWWLPSANHHSLGWVAPRILGERNVFILFRVASPPHPVALRWENLIYPVIQSEQKRLDDQSSVFCFFFLQDFSVASPAIWCSLPLTHTKEYLAFYSRLESSPFFIPNESFSTTTALKNVYCSTIYIHTHPLCIRTT